MLFLFLGEHFNLQCVVYCVHFLKVEAILVTPTYLTLVVENTSLMGVRQQRPLQHFSILMMRLIPLLRSSL